MIETELDVLHDVSRRLESAGITFMLTGSVAMNYYAQPRMTRDIDLVVSLNETQIEEFFRLFDSEYYFDRQNLRSRAKTLKVDVLLEEILGHE
jgi:hypothetical protein